MQKNGRHAATEKHNHIAQMIELLHCLSSMQLESETMISFYVIHRDRCHIHKGKFCNCDPTVSMVPPGFHKIRNAMLRRAKELKEISL